MCEILVKAIDFTNPDPVLDALGAWKQGMPVVVMDDGHEWGDREGLPKFWIVKLPGVTVESALKYIATWDDPANPNVPIKRREWVFDINSLPLDAKAKLNTVGVLVIRVPPYNGPYDITWGTARSAFKNVRLGTTE